MEYYEGLRWKTLYELHADVQIEGEKMKIGFYGGKFMPLHLGHLFCIAKGSSDCDILHVIMFINGCDEIKIRRKDKSEYLSVERRTENVKKICECYSNIKFHVVDVAECKLPDGSEDWDEETPLVRQYIPHMDTVYSSEPGYEEYFSRAYPEAEHILIDPERIKFPISGTMIRAMEKMEDKEKWMV